MLAHSASGQGNVELASRQYLQDRSSLDLLLGASAGTVSHGPATSRSAFEDRRARFHREAVQLTPNRLSVDPKDFSRSADCSGFARGTQNLVPLAALPSLSQDHWLRRAGTDPMTQL